MLGILFLQKSFAIGSTECGIFGRFTKYLNWKLRTLTMISTAPEQVLRLSFIDYLRRRGNLSQIQTRILIGNLSRVTILPTRIVIMLRTLRTLSKAPE